MKKFGKLVFGSALLGAAAYGIHTLVNQLEQDEDLYESEYQDEAGDDKDYYADEAGTTEDTAEAIKAAAGRAYTTIQHSSRQAMDKVKEAVGPKGEEVINEVGSAAKEMGKTVTDSASRIRDILQKKDDEEEAVAPAEESAAEEAAPAEEGAPAAEAAQETVNADKNSYVTLKSAAAEVKEAAQETAEALKDAADAGKVEQFFDDEEE